MGPAPIAGQERQGGSTPRSRAVDIPTPDRGAAAALFSPLAGSGAIALGTGTGAFPQPVQPAAERRFRGRGDFCARRGALPGRTGRVFPGSTGVGGAAGLLAGGGVAAAGVRATHDFAARAGGVGPAERNSDSGTDAVSVRGQEAPRESAGGKKGEGMEGTKSVEDKKQSRKKKGKEAKKKAEPKLREVRRGRWR